jgi:phage gpG-like protein
MATVAVSDDRLRRQLRALVSAGSRQGGLALVSHLQKKLNVSARVGATKSGRRGGRPKGRRSYTYQASRPGEPPRKRTGTLQKSVESRVEEEPQAIVTLVGSKVPYAVHLEYGTRRMRARPWLRPGVNEFLARFHRIVIDRVRAGLGTFGSL